ncbi:hypothetical protein Patl1_04049 [Pistacia atlantica]|uniref:Uncharacterized protein n=1 Tax=Pistacia atlantica TaxID=434234 RepID=A0ACC1BTD8_9ROSI|nr:hypothetical protein Patl1_04049 [Pistacia atlantica]
MLPPLKLFIKIGKRLTLLMASQSDGWFPIDFTLNDLSSVFCKYYHFFLFWFNDLS